MKIYCPQCKKVIEPEIPTGAQEINCPECSTALPVPENNLAPGAVIGDFLLEKPLSSGGMGMVYLARQISLDRPVALKVLREKFADNQEYIEGLFREARAAAKLTHPNIVQAYAVGEENGIFYFAMEYIRGETFKQILKRQNILEFDQAVKVIKEICGALQAAWNEQKLVHQDIKPDNIMLDANGFAKLADLGLARSANTDSGPSEDETEVMGTPQYISPEQLTGVPTDVRSDIYSLGATFYQFVTGQFPYPEETAEAMARKHVEGNLTPPKEINPELPQQLNDIIVKMMARHIEERYQSPADIVKALDAYSLQTASVAIPKLSLNFSQKGGAKGKSPLPPPKFGPAAATTAKPGTVPKIGVPGTTAKPAVAMPKTLAAKPATPAKPAVPAKPATPAKPAVPAKPAAPEKTEAPATAAPAPAQAAEVPKTEVAPAPNQAGQPQPEVPATPAPAPAAKSDELTLAPPKPKKAPAEKEESEGKEGAEGKAKEKVKKGKDKERIERPSRNKWSLITYLVFLPIFLIFLAVLFYVLAQKGKLPEKLKAPGEKYAAFVNSVFKIKKAAPGTAQTAAPQGVPPQDLPKPKPKPVTRKAFVDGVKNLLDNYRSNPDKGIQFLENADKLLAQFLPVITDEEAKALSALRVAYAPADENFRFAPKRQEAVNAWKQRLQAERDAKANALKAQLESAKQQQSAAESQAAEEAKLREQAARTKAENDARTRKLTEDFNKIYQSLAKGFYLSIDNNSPQPLNDALTQAQAYLISSSCTTPAELAKIAEFKAFQKFLPGALKEIFKYKAAMEKISESYPVPPLTVQVGSSMRNIVKVVPGKAVYYQSYDGKIKKLSMNKGRIRKEFFNAIALSPLKSSRHIFYYEFMEKKVSQAALAQIKRSDWEKYLKLFSPELKLVK